MTGPPTPADRAAVLDVLARFAHGIDGRDWELYRSVFTEDAVIDYTEMGGIRGSLDEQKAFLASVMPSFGAFQHLTATSTFDIDGDVARVRTICFNPMVVTDERQVLFCGLWYRDVMVRTPDGWRIRERHEDRGWSLDVRA